MCPFKANRDWLVDDTSRHHVLKLLTRAEVLSGKSSFLGMPLAIISLILAGCPRDYDGVHPCEWVRAKVTGHDVFSLATRRIYMSLFASSSPYGLEAVEVLRRKQIDAFRGLCEVISQGSTPTTSTAIRHVMESIPPTTDVGVTRLLGEQGVIAALDPCREALPSDFYDKWDSDLDSVPMDIKPFITEFRANLRVNLEGAGAKP
jgi:hypothetical protein